MSTVTSLQIIEGLGKITGCLIRFLLTQERYKVLDESNDEEGVELALKKKTDLVRMDIRLPAIDGLEATRRQSETGHDIPIIAVTSFAMTGDWEKALEAGCTNYLEKPIDLDTFQYKIRSLLMTLRARPQSLQLHGRKPV